jgi:hypothetical protein
MSERVVCLTLLAVCIALLTWDVFAVAHEAWDKTVSVWVLRNARSHPIATFMLGLICGVCLGHFLWPIRSA